MAKLKSACRAKLYWEKAKSRNGAEILSRCDTLNLTNSIMKPAVTVEQLTKHYGDLTAVDHLNFEVEAGTLYGFIGPDGAGKSTLFRILTTLLLPDEGEVYVDGFHVVNDYRELRKRLGYMPGEFSLYTDLSVRENLEFFASVFGSRIQDQYDLIEPIYKQLEPFADRRAGALSGGMKQKLALSCALIHRPTILILDEPTTGVDAVSRQEFWQSLRDLLKENMTILVSTPYMDEAAQCDQVALINKGEILTVNTPDGIRNQYPKPLLGIEFHESSSRRYELIQELRKLDYVESVQPFGGSLHVTLVSESYEPGQLVQEMAEAGFPGLQAQPIQAGIEDRFMNLMGSSEA